MYLAEALAQKGHEVLFVSIQNKIEPTTYRNVEYVNWEDLSPNTHCDYVVTTNNVHDYVFYDKISQFKKIIMIMHNEIYNDHPHKRNNFEPMFQFPPETYIIAFVSEISKKNFVDTQPFLQCCKNILLHNSLDLNDLVPTQWNHKMNIFAFFTAYERGFKMVSKIADFFPQFAIWTNSYNDGEKQWILSEKASNPSNQIAITASSSKHLIYSHLAHAKYFIYPLIDLDHKNTNASPFAINTDTFGYSILEALLHGVVVLTPRMAVYEELFGDAICYIDTDDIIPRSKLSEWKIKCEMLGEPIIQRYINKINELEINEELRKSYVEKGYALKDKYSHAHIADQLLQHLN
jgi:hypothetical protein